MVNDIPIINVRECSSSQRINNKEFGEDRFLVNQKNVSSWNYLYLFLIIAGCFPAILIFTLIPRHNSIFYPEYWYEYMFPYVFPVAVRITANQMLEIFIFMRLQTMKSAWVFSNNFYAY